MQFESAGYFYIAAKLTKFCAHIISGKEKLAIAAAHYLSK
jgi:hypothetical protein